MLRLQAGMSEIGLAKAAGVQYSLIRSIERNNSQPDLLVRTVVAIADALAVRPVDLFLEREAGSQENHDDSTRLETLLAMRGKMVPKRTIARTLDWNLARVVAAAEALADRLASSGCRLHYLPGRGYKVVPRAEVMTDEERVRFDQAVISVRGLLRTEAKILFAVAHGRLPKTWRQNATRPDRMIEGALIKHGLVEREGGDLVLTEAARFSLALDD